MPAPASSDAFARRLLARLPGAVFLLDEMGCILYASPRGAALLDLTAEELLGESVLNFVTEKRAWSAAAALAMATDYRGVVTGPLQVGFVDRHGRERQADLWAENYLDDPEIGGILCLLTPETVAVWLGEAVEAVAHDADLDVVAAHVVTAMRGNPVVADAVLLAPSEGDGPLAPLGPTEVPIELCDDGDDTPWRVAWRERRRQIHGSLDVLAAEVVDAAHAAGYRAVWSEPVRTEKTDPCAVLVVWRRRAGIPSPNQIKLLHQAGTILALAWDRKPPG